MPHAPALPRILGLGLRAGAGARAARGCTGLGYTWRAGLGVASASRPETKIICTPCSVGSGAGRVISLPAVCDFKRRRGGWQADAAHRAGNREEGGGVSLAAPGRRYGDVAVPDPDMAMSACQGRFAVDPVRRGKAQFPVMAGARKTTAPPPPDHPSDPHSRRCRGVPAVAASNRTADSSSAAACQLAVAARPGQAKQQSNPQSAATWP